MDINFQTILKIAADALSLKYSLDYAVLYWQSGQDSIVTKASLTITDSPARGGGHLVLSESMIAAIRKPLVITKSNAAVPRLQIIIPLIENNQKQGIMAFWGKPGEETATESDRRFLDMIGLISLQVLNGLQQGRFAQSTEGRQATTTTVAVRRDDKPEEFLNVGPLDREETRLFQAGTSEWEEEEQQDIFVEPPTEEEPGLFDDMTNTSFANNDEPEFSEASAQDQTDLKRLLAVLDVGFLMFDKSGRIETEHLLVNPGFFNLTLTDKTALEVLFEWGEPINTDSASFEKKPKYELIVNLMQSVFKRVTDIDVLKEFLPKEIQTQDKLYGLAYHYNKSPRSAADDDRIIAVFRDNSREKMLSDQYATEIERSNMIIKVALDIDGYYQYRRSTEDTLRTIEEELARPATELKLESVLHHIQAIQGGAEIYEINEITAISEELITSLEQKIKSYTPLSQKDVDTFSHRITLLKDRFAFLQEQYLNNLISDEQILDKAVYRNTSSKINRIRDMIIENVIRKRLEELEVTFEKNYKPFTRLKSLEDITQKRLHRIKEHVRTQVTEPGIQEVIDYMSELRKQPIGLMLKRYAIIAVNLGERMKKRVEVEIKGADIEIPFHTLENLFISLTFVIRNCVEHGLESMEERIALDKSLEGNIAIEAYVADNRLRIKISDDGRGIDVDKIRQVAIKNRVMAEEEGRLASDNQILKFMFSRGFSTKKDTAGTFGRGVGLNAVGAAIAELGGDVNVSTRLKQGTSIEVEVPLS